MSDLALTWSDAEAAADLALDGATLAIDEGLRTAITVSLFTDARARVDDELPAPGADPRGWWGDALSADGRELGSRLWLLARRTITNTTLAEAREMAEEALAWLADDGHVASLAVMAEREGDDRLALRVTFVSSQGGEPGRYDVVLPLA